MVDAGEWRKITPEALLPHQDQPAWDQKPTAPFVMRLGDRLRMYYDGRLRRPNKAANEVRIGFAEASVDDPLTWTKHERNPVFDVSEPGGFDSEWVSYPWVVPITDTHWHMYYAGFGGEYRREGTEKTWRTALAESDDAGLTWRRSGNGPIFEHGIAGSPHEGCSGSCAVLKVGGEYWMYYTAVADREEYERGLRITIALAVSTDGGHTFSPHEAGAVVAPDRDNPIETYVTSKPTVQLQERRLPHVVQLRRPDLPRPIRRERGRHRLPLRPARRRPHVRVGLGLRDDGVRDGAGAAGAQSALLLRQRVLRHRRRRARPLSPVQSPISSSPSTGED